MTTRYECDRCHRQTDDPKLLTSVTMKCWIGNMSMETEYHYCDFCGMIMRNALSITNSGAYCGMMGTQDKIGAYPPNRAEYDPLLKMECGVDPGKIGE